MSDTLLTPTTITMDDVASILEDALMDIERDADGDIIIKGRHRTLLMFTRDNAFIQLSSRFRPNPASSLEDRLAFVNELNDTTVGIRCFISRASGGFGFEFYIALAGGVTRKNIALTIRKYQDLLASVIAKDVNDLIA